VALNRVAIPSPNYSARNSGVRLIVLHTAEGARTIESLGNFFANPGAGVSSHAGADDSPGRIGVYVKRGDKAWTQGDANPYSVSIELCAFAAWDAAEWSRHPVMLENTAAWIAEEAAAFGIPIVGTGAGGTGVLQHNDLGAMGGGHWDCGPNFPIAQVIAMAAEGGSMPSVQPKRKGKQMIASTKSGNGYWTTTSDGAVYAFGDAQFRGSSFDVDPKTPGNQAVKITGEVVGIAGCGNDGYWLLASDGGIFTFGSAQFYGRPDRT
jgi:N-acetylmuramoyl-L-alanine amidase